MADIRVTNHGTILLLHGVSPVGTQWLLDHTPEDAAWFGDGVAVEPRYARDIVLGAQDDGLVVI